MQLVAAGLVGLILGAGGLAAVAALATVGGPGHGGPGHGERDRAWYSEHDRGDGPRGFDDRGDFRRGDGEGRP